MLTATIVMAASMAVSNFENDNFCPVMGSPAKMEGVAVEYKGASYKFCCAGCVDMFNKEPDKWIKKTAEKDMVAGTFLFDPVTGNSIKAKKAKASMDYKGIRYHFSSEENLALFKADPKKFTAVPAKEQLHCPVMDSPVANYTKASGYVDHNGVRYYMCCGGCQPAFAKDPKKFSGDSDGKKPAAITVEDKKKD